MRKTTLFVLAGVAVALVAGRRPGGAVKNRRQVIGRSVRVETGAGGVEGDAGAVDGAEVEAIGEGGGEEGGEEDVVDAPVEESAEEDDKESLVVADDEDAFAIEETPVEATGAVEKTEKADEVEEAAEKVGGTAMVEKPVKSEKTVKSSDVAAAPQAEPPKEKEVVTEPLNKEPVSMPPTPADDEDILPALSSDPATSPSDSDSPVEAVFGASGDTAEDLRPSSSTAKRVRRKQGLNRRTIVAIAGYVAAAVVLAIVICALVVFACKQRHRRDYDAFKYSVPPVGKAPLVRRDEEESSSGGEEGFSKAFPDGGVAQGGARPGGYAEDHGSKRGMSASRGGGFGSGSRAEGFVEEDSVGSSTWSEIVAPNVDASMNENSLGNTFQQRLSRARDW